MGFKYATLSGISISIDDLRVPAVKKDILKSAETDVTNLNKRLDSNKITEEEFQLRSNEIWRRASGDISDRMEDEFGQLNNVFIMANSGARGNIDQVRQLAGMRGLMSDAQGRTIKVPIKSNFKEGLSLAEYFISCYLISVLMQTFWTERMLSYLLRHSPQPLSLQKKKLRIFYPKLKL